VNSVVSSVATIWKILEDAGDTGHAGRQPELPLPHLHYRPSAVSTYFRTQKKNMHQTKEGEKNLLNWHPCFISATHLAVSATTLEICICSFVSHSEYISVCPVFHPLCSYSY
jgi:hypothetical protein